MQLLNKNGPGVEREGRLPFVFWESDQQRDRLENLWHGDLVVLK